MKEISREPARLEHIRRLGKRTRKLVEITCLHCGAKASKTTETRHGTPRFCSDNCSNLFRYHAKKKEQASCRT